ncbi:MAG: DUF427 domain-containing protein [Chloroflexi bacterium]|nr:DUF427 domain-containing protein [Chloroflexota bacterium]
MAFVIRAKNDQQTLLASSELAAYPVLVEGEHWYFHPNQVNMKYLKQSERTWKCPYRGIGNWYNLDVPGIRANNVAWIYPHADGDYAHFAGYIGFWGRETAISTAEQTLE